MMADKEAMEVEPFIVEEQLCKRSGSVLLILAIELLFIMIFEFRRLFSLLKFVSDGAVRRIRYLENELKERDAEIERLKEENVDITDTVKKIDKIVKQLQRILGMNSTNSGWSSSTDGIKNFGNLLKMLSQKYNRLIARMFPNTTVTTVVPTGRSHTKTPPKQDKKKPGAQPGHDPASMNCIGMKPTKEVVHMPEKCTGCPNYEKCKKNAKKKDCRMVYDIKIIIEAIAHYMGVVECPQTGENLSGCFPANVTSRFQYGSGVWGLCAILVEFGCVSIKRTGDILRDAFSIPISDGTVMNAIMRGGELAIPFVAHFRKHILLSPCSSHDETGRHMRPSPEIIAVKKKYSDKSDAHWNEVLKKGKAITIWIHTAVTPLYTVLHPSLFRGKTGMLEGGILQNRYGVIVHDCLAAYWYFTQCEHGLCIIHLGRDSTGIKERDSRQAGWLDRLMSFLYRQVDFKKEAIDAWKRLKAAGAIPSDDKPRLSQTYIDAAVKELHDIIAAGRAVNPQPYVDPEAKGPGRKKKTDAANLLDRLEEHAEDWIRFILNLDAWENNTIAERSFRDQKVSESVSKMMRTMDGMWAQCRIKSVIDTARKHRIPPVKALIQMYEGCPPEEVFHDPLPEYLLNLALIFDSFDLRSPYSIATRSLPAHVDATENRIDGTQSADVTMVMAPVITTGAGT